MNTRILEDAVSIWPRYRLLLPILLSILFANPSGAAENPNAPQPTAAPEMPAGGENTNLEAFASRLNLVDDAVELAWLGSGNAKRVALYQAPLQIDNHGAVLVMLGGGKLLEQSEFARSVRHTLPGSGWATLVVQNESMMAGKSSAPEPESVQNTLTEALKYLSAKNYAKHIVVADGEIATMLWPALQSQSVIGFVGIDQWSAEQFQPSIPVLNIANNALPKAVKQAQLRFNRVKQKPTAPCEVYFYDGTIGSDLGYGQAVSRRLRGWLSRQFLQRC